MKKLLILMLIAGLIAGSMVGVADARKKKKKRVQRKVDFTYTCPCPGVLQLGSLDSSNIGGGPVVTGADDNFVMGEVEDMSGQPVEVDIEGDTDGDGFNDAIASFCGKTEEPLAIPAGLELRIFIKGIGVCTGTQTPVVGLGGTVHFTFSNVP